jgi:putative membrane protein insertion efficiency factor
VNLFARGLVVVISFYRRVISPLFPAHCRYEPSCSAYAIEAIHVHGAGRGVVLAARRIGRCHPWGGTGLDPVPDRRVRS